MHTHSIDIPAITPGSSLYYALLYTPKPQQDAVALLLAFFNEIKSIPNQVSETEIAKTKLMWWTKEIAQTYKHYPQHPLTQALSATIERYALDELAFLDYIKEIHASLDTPPLAIADKLASPAKACGSKLLLLSAVTGHIVVPKEFISHLAMALQAIHDIRYIGREIKNYPELYPQENNDALLGTLRNLASTAKSNYAHSLKVLNAQQREKLLALIIYANIQLALLVEIEKLDFQLLDKKISLTPLRKLWIAWRTKRQEKKTIKQLYKKENS